MARHPPGALRRSRHLVSYWRAGELLFHNYATGVRVAVRPETPVVLDFFEEWRTPAEVRERFGARPDALAPLIAATLLERMKDPRQRQKSSRSTPGPTGILRPGSSTCPQGVPPTWIP